MKALLQNDTLKKVLTVLAWIGTALFFTLLMSSCTALGGMQGQDRHYRASQKFQKRYHAEIRSRRAKLKRGWYTSADNVSTVTGVELPKKGL